MPRSILALALLLGCDPCRDECAARLWLTWHGYGAVSVDRIEPPAIGSWPCDQGQTGWGAVADRRSSEPTHPTVRVNLVVCCPDSGPCRGRETSE